MAENNKNTQILAQELAKDLTTQTLAEQQAAKDAIELAAFRANKAEQLQNFSKKEQEELEVFRQEKLDSGFKTAIKEDLKTSGLKTNIDHLIKLFPKLKDLKSTERVEHLNVLAKNKETKYLFDQSFGVGDLKINKQETKGKEPLFFPNTTIRLKKRK